MSEYKDYGFKSEASSHSHAYIFPVVNSLLTAERNKKILDVGCGNGSFARKLINGNFDVYGTDASVNGIRIAKSFHPDRFFLQDLTKDDLPEELKNEKFDTILSTEVIEHLYDPNSYILFCKKILTRYGGGELILSTPYNGYFKNLLLSIFDKWDNHLNPLWDGGHIKFWSRNTLTQILINHGFSIVDFKGAGRIPFLWKSMVIKAKI